jgi:hypothetical protein
MPANVLIQSGSGTNVSADVIQGKQDYPRGLVTFTESLRNLNAGTSLILNSEVGADMNINGSVSGTPKGIHDGGDTTYWTPTANGGTWDFADTTNPSSGTQCVSLTNGQDGNQASFDDSGTTDMSNYVSLTGVIRLERYNATQSSILLQFNLAGLVIGTSINLDNYLDIGLINAYQSFQIPKTDFEIGNQIVDNFTITIQRNGGSRPIFRFDLLQLEQTGGSTIFSAVPNTEKIFRAQELTITMSDNITGIVTNGTMPGLTYNQILGVPLLSNGITIRWSRKGTILFTKNIKSLFDFFNEGFLLKNSVSDGTNTLLTLSYNFGDCEFLMDPRESDALYITINDNLSGLLAMRTTLHGNEETIKEILT